MNFGKLLARTHTIKFQKRGYPHVHIIFWLHKKVVMDTKKINKLICAEKPDEYIFVQNTSGILERKKKKKCLYTVVIDK